MCLLLIGVFLANSRATILALVFGLLQFDYIRKPKTLLIAFSHYVINSLRDTLLSKIRSGKPAELYSNLYLDFAKGIRDKNEETCHLTIHKSKGLEFDNVLLVFDETKKALDFLLKTDLNKTEDDHRLYYVACSRAKHRLFLSIPSLSESEQVSIQNKYGKFLTIKAN